ncbi:tRNA uridine-5-carboxymethylaminomethyl(34) synthesis GTPase MnmE [Ferruginibacter albus]|uniref:tRNA uridine-5-carboxymethylaminomethyl(34) synthesis GTPase MnmE n=1 Tax=Ferruginibacter albus TaxID=2875540 RepID=UPI001CC7DB40|nr:tRNA uridine-5-carboxymethylaminomethyl(34) synthesis GTPase MnmE [Ferruginibacter albus]UAY51564.1 tRNA uridine-5-carboxymethylaminomethyl(34) synthesis GTPase MnmE [Ferruginibacter albus]
MLNNLSGWDDTIVALATPPGIGAIGVIRLSGKESFSIINSLFPSKELLKQASHTLHVGFIKEDDKVLDEVVVSLFKNPKSYTGEDVVEISCHGSPYVQQQVLQACINKGARLAKAGEFTQRAFLNGKLDLTQAEAVADLIASNTSASQKAALHNIRGGFSDVLKQLREELITFSALIELELDFSQEDVEFADRKKFYELIEKAQVITNELLESFQLGNVIRNGISVAIIGKPNAGKSTLLNTLLNEDRAIVSDIAGTTRDTIEEVININDVLFRLIDTAGIREHTSDIIESIGVEKSLAKMRSADIVLYLFDVNSYTAEDLLKIEKDLQRQQINYLLIGNKADTGSTNFENALLISAKQQQGIKELKEKLFAATVHNDIAENAVVTNSRHHAALQKISESLAAIKTGLDKNISGDLLTPDIHRCLHYISEITGTITNETVLDYVFSKFCIGK